MILVELFTSDHCRLCADAKAVLQRVANTQPFTLREIRLLPGDTLYDEYRDMVPVVHIDRVPVFRHRIQEGMLRIRLQQLVSERSRPLTEDDAESGEIVS